MINNNNWIEYNDYWLNKYAQRTKEWYNVRIGRLTCSNIGTSIGENINCKPDELADYITEIKKKEFTTESQELMDYGTENEPIARKWYENYYNSRNNQAIVKEIGLVIPKFDYRLGSSLDGAVVSSEDEDPLNTEGMIEIKCPKKLYNSLKLYNIKKSKGWIPENGYNAHIIPTHWIQMQSCMAITNKKWCDYIVYCIPEEKIFLERIYFDHNNWVNNLYPRILNFLNNILEPRLKQQGISIEMPK